MWVQPAHKAQRGIKVTPAHKVQKGISVKQARKAKLARQARRVILE